MFNFSAGFINSGVVLHSGLGHNLSTILPLFPLIFLLIPGNGDQTKNLTRLGKH